MEILDEYKPYFIYGSGDALDDHTGEPLNIKGCVANGIPEETASLIWDKMESFGSYAFNKSHAAAYAVVSVQTAWLAYYYPVIFMKANLNVYISNPDKLKAYLAFCIKNNIEILPPSVNHSEEFFSLNADGTKIRFGLKGVKNLDKVSKLIIEERNERGTFNSLYDFISRMIKHQKLNKRVLEALIYVGALDEFEGTRKSKIENLEHIMEMYKHIVLPNQATIFDLAEEFNICDMHDLITVELDNTDELTKDEKYGNEFTYSGFYITGHPLEDYKAILDSGNIIDIAEVVNDENSELYKGCFIKLAGIISNLEKKNTKSGDYLYTFDLSDMTGSINTVCFSKSFIKNADKIEEGAKVVINGKFDVNDFGPQFITDTVTRLDSIYENISAVNLMSHENIDVARQQYVDLKALIPENTGNVKLNFIRDNVAQPGMPSVEMSLELLSKLQRIFGEQGCKLVWS